MTLFDRILAVYHELDPSEINPLRGTIHLRNDSDGRGDYIAEWNHPTLPRPTDAQLEGQA